MKSSSELFPVSLLRADSFSGLTEDVYLVKHNRDPDLSVQVAVSHLGRENIKSTGQPVILLHGEYSNRGFWLSQQGDGLARYLLEQGFDVWMMDMRGHGMSPRNHDYRNNNIERFALFDIPAVTEFVNEKTSVAPAWVGHASGGVTIASAVAGRVLNTQNCSGMVLLAAQAVRRPVSQWIPFVTLAARGRVRLKGELDGPGQGVGPENEPAGLINEALVRQSLFGSWQFKSTAQKLMPAWKEGCEIPLLALVAAADKTDPARYCMRFANLYGGSNKTIINAGTAGGLSRNYGHTDLANGKSAEEEIWPQIAVWLQNPTAERQPESAVLAAD